MPKKRIPIPKDVENDLLFKNDMSCCICQKSGGVIIHHIDGNPANNEIDNLAVLCQEHHDTIHKKGGLTKNFTPQIIKKYKRHWEAFNSNKRAIKKSPLQSKSGIERILFEFEIRKTTYEIVSLDDKNEAELKQKLEYLYSIYLFEEYSTEILSAIDQIVLLLSFSDSNKSALIAEDMHHYVWHLIGPKEVPLTKNSKNNLYQILGILETIGTFSAEFDKNNKVIGNLLNSIYYLSDIAIRYNLKDFAKTLLGNIAEIKEKCKIDMEGHNDFKKSIEYINVFIAEFEGKIKTEKPTWSDLITT